MKAIRFESYGPPDVLQVKEVEKPTPKEDEVLLRVYAASINAKEWHMLTADIFLVRFMGVGLRKPKDPRLGTDVSGRVEAVGSKVTRFRPGDEVFGFGIGTYAEYAVAKEKNLLLKPANLSFEQVAAVPIAALTALQGLRSVGKLQAGQKVVIQGASGGVGMFATQIAKALGAEVTAVCSPRNIDMVRSFGADHIIDYTKEDFTQNGQQYDLILAVNGHHPLPHYLRALKPGGILAIAGGNIRQLLESLFLARLIRKPENKKAGMVDAKMDLNDLAFLTELLETGKVVPVIDAVYPLEKTVEAFRHYEKVHAKGKILIKAG